MLLALGLGAAIFLLDSGSIADPDIWWHLRNAEVLVQTHSVVHHDFYSFTATGSRWINEAWLSELPYYLGWRWLGIRGIYLVMLGEVELILLGVFGLAYLSSRNVKATFVASWLAVWLATVSFGPRTLLAGWMCLVAELFILAQFKQGKDRAWLLPPLFVLWANLHGSWLIGMVLLGIFCAAGLVQGKWGRLQATRWTPAQMRKLALAGSLSVAGLFLNPYTYHLVFYPFNFAFKQKLNVNHVDEWMSLDFHSVRGKIIFLMLAATIVLALVRKRRWALDELAFLLLGFYAAMTYSRFLFLAAIVLTPMLARALDFFPPYRPEIDKTWLNAILMAVLLGLCIWRFPSRDQLMRDTIQSYPVKALNYLQHFQPQGRVFNDCLWGGYLIWNVAQDSRLYRLAHRYLRIQRGLRRLPGCDGRQEHAGDPGQIPHPLRPVSTGERRRLPAAAQLRMEDAISGWDHGLAGAGCYSQIASQTGPRHPGVALDCGGSIRVGTRCLGVRYSATDA